MSQSIIYNIPRGTLRMEPGWKIDKDDGGLYKSSATFHCHIDDYETAVIQDKLKRLTPITSISPDISPYWSFLLLISHSAETVAGGYKKITAEFQGRGNGELIEEENEIDEGIPEDERDIPEKNRSYTRNGSLIEESILSHPDFVDEVSASDSELFRLAIAGVYREREDSTANQVIVSPANGSHKIVGIITDEDTLAWWDYVIRKGNHTYFIPTTEWTVNATGLRRLSSGELAGLGKIATPPGNPGTPSGMNWLFWGVTETIQVRNTEGVENDSPNSYSKTYMLGRWPIKLYQK